MRRRKKTIANGNNTCLTDASRTKKGRLSALQDCIFNKQSTPKVKQNTLQQDQTIDPSMERQVTSCVKNKASEFCASTDAVLVCPNNFASIWCCVHDGLAEQHLTWHGLVQKEELPWPDNFYECNHTAKAASGRRQTQPYSVC